MKNLNRFLVEFTNNSNNPNTHICINPGGKYIIPDNKLNTFHDLYNKALEKNTKISMIECHKKTGPIVIDIDFKFDKTKLSRQYKKIGRAHV